MAVMDTLTKAQDRVLDTIEENNGRMIETMERVAGTVEKVADRGPDVELPFELPLVDQLPKPAEMVSNYFDFVNRSMEINRKFAERVVEIVVPAAKPATKSTRKPAAKKAA